MSNEYLLELTGIEKSFTGTKVLRGIDLNVSAGEFVTLLGPSGCGKTTTLRIIAGLEMPDAGTVRLAGQDVTRLEPNRRNVNTVFQNYALFPHMNVETNIGYSLRLRRMSRADIAKTVNEALELVQLPGYGRRMPSELSGGQRQRVAIARAIVNRPQVLLLDEPLGALDLQLRRQMQQELKKFQKQLGITFIYITHDQEEAINMSDRIAVMRDGQFVQIGSPNEIYESPRTAFAARFVGNANVLKGTVTGEENGILAVAVAGDTVYCRASGGKVGDEVCLAVRGESVEMSDTGILATVAEKSFNGGMLRITMDIADGRHVVVTRQGINADVAVGDTVRLNWKKESAVQVEEDDEV